MSRPHGGAERTLALGSGLACVQIPALPFVSYFYSAVTESLWTWLWPCLGGNTGLLKREISLEGQVTLSGFRKGVSREGKHLSWTHNCPREMPASIILVIRALRRWELQNDWILQNEDVVWIGRDENGRLALWSSSQCSAVMIITSGESQLRDSLPNIWLVLLQGYEKQGKSEKLSQPRGA